MIAIYKNEAFILMDKIKEDFKKHYKHLELTITITMDETNNLLNGFYLTLSDAVIKTRKSKFVDVNGFFTASDYYDYIIIVINDLFDELIKSYYTI